MDKNKKKFFLKYIANLSLIAMCTFFLNTNVIFAEGQEGGGENTNIYLKKCTDLYRVDGNLTLDDDLDYIGKCQSNDDSEPLVKVKTDKGYSFIPVGSDPLNGLQKDEDGNVPLYCKKVLPDENYIGGQENLGKYKLIERNINNIKLCGDGWNNFVYKSSLIKNYTKSKHWYPTYGAYSNSYEYILNKVLSGEYTCTGISDDPNNDSCLNNLNTSKCDDFRQKCFPLLLLGVGDEYCEKEYANSKECDNIKENTPNIKNKFYRERSYGGMEFGIPINANEAIDNGYASIDGAYDGNGCFDPRMPSDKGYYGTKQRYYFRGKLKANYACDRFIYKGNKTCVKKD